MNEKVQRDKNIKERENKRKVSKEKKKKKSWRASSIYRREKMVFPYTIRTNK